MTDLLPKDFQITDNPICSRLINTLGSARLEFAAAVIIRWHQLHGHENWIEFSLADIGSLFGTGVEDADPIVLVWAHNPFWRPDPVTLWSKGFIEGWMENHPHKKGKLTDKFFEAIERERERRKSKELAW